MVRSMTGFGRGVTEDESERSFTIEIKSVNHRYFDLNIKMPRNLMSFESKIREVIKNKVNRGKVDVFITQNLYENDDVEINFNENLADNYLKCLESIKDRYSVKDDVSVSLIAKFQDVITVQKKEQDLDEIWNFLYSPLNKAIDSLVSMREKEGAKLKDDIIAKCDIISNLVCDIEKRSPRVVEEYKEKLNKRIKELVDDIDIDDSRIATEVAIFADKSAVDEEFVRLHSHIVQLKDTLDKDEPIGRKLDFIIQEMNRESNTISSKGNDLEIVNLIIDVKNLIEKIREQVQNIE